MEEEIAEATVAVDGAEAAGMAGEVAAETTAETTAEMDAELAAMGPGDGTPEEARG